MSWLLLVCDCLDIVAACDFLDNVPTCFTPRPFGLQADLILGANGHVNDELAARIEEQRAKIRELELAVEERKRADEVRIQKRARETECIR